MSLLVTLMLSICAKCRVVKIRIKRLKSHIALLECSIIQMNYHPNYIVIRLCVLRSEDYTSFSAFLRMDKQVQYLQ